MPIKTKTTKAKAPRAKKAAQKAGSDSMTVPLYNVRGEQAGTFTLPETIFGHKWNADLVHQVITTMQGNLRKPIAHTKTRGEVSGGGKKPWRQKGTGRARHGSSRSPIWRHGGVTHGPRNDRDYGRKVNRKMKQAALYTLLSAKMRDGELIFVDQMALSIPKTKEAQTFLGNLAKAANANALTYKKGNRALIALPAHDLATYKSFRNIQSAHVEEARNLNPLTVAKYKYIVIARPEESLKQLAK